MPSPRRPALVLPVLALAVALLVALPARAQACELLNQLLVGCPPPATVPVPPPLPLPPVGELPGVITLPTTPSLPPPPAPPPAAPVPPGGRPVLLPEAAGHLLDLANAERAAAGAQPLTSRPDVTEVAAGHSLAMAERGAIWHNAAYVTDVVADLLGATWVRGENVAWSNDLDHTHRLLMESPAHRTNMLDPRYSVAGFAVARSGDGNYWVTQNFLQPRSSSGPASAGIAPSPRGTSHPGEPAPDRPSPASAELPAPVVPAPSAGGEADQAPIAIPVEAGRVPESSPEDLEGAVLATGLAAAGGSPAGLAGLAAALVGMVGLGHGVSWWSVRGRP